MIPMIICVKTHSNNQMEFEQTLEEFQSDGTQITGLIKKWQNENGCLSYQLHRENVGNYSLESKWQSWDDLNNHFRSKNFTLFLGAINVLCETPEVIITDGKSSFGIEAIKAARGEQNIP